MMRNHEALRCALEIVDETLRRGKRTHKPGDWLRLSAGEHAAKAVGHLRRFALGINNEDHLAHAATRLLMALERRERCA